jgi:hypothetical protein
MLMMVCFCFSSKFNVLTSEVYDLMLSSLASLFLIPHKKLVQNQIYATWFLDFS